MYRRSLYNECLRFWSNKNFDQNDLPYIVLISILRSIILPRRLSSKSKNCIKNFNWTLINFIEEISYIY